MWSQSWDNVLDIVTPYPSSTSVDVTPQLVAQVSPNNLTAFELNLFLEKRECL